MKNGDTAEPRPAGSAPIALANPMPIALVTVIHWRIDCCQNINNHTLGFGISDIAFIKAGE